MVAKCRHLKYSYTIWDTTTHFRAEPWMYFMSLRNIGPRNSLCNGTQIFVWVLNRNIIMAEVFSGSHAGDLVLIPKIILRPLDAHLPFQFYH